MASHQGPPDLASILATLAGLAPQGQQHQNQPIIYSQQSSHFEQPQQAWTPIIQEAPHIPRSTTPTEPPPQKPGVDPSTIIEWSAGLRCVMKSVARNENITNDIRRMMKVQREHEEQWWNGRKMLIEKQKARKEGQKKLDDVLKAVGGAVTGFASNHSDDHDKELQTFDMKVYKAQLMMVKEMTAKLRSLGVPFFGTRSELVRLAGKEENASNGTPEQKIGNGMIDEVELIDLQRRMLVILEDLCSD
ncbi:uncharacterized protein RSE6_08935 [Rhynchosporium secalis]|uniref:Uncharacterized protein n=1 Tax=Rhynchosporium secalis TaxID=38038 RepID=A0A1E1MGN2_RHYSE|nr:uncharacterized protein RSE6_08935 [Rhynchosporium secalis]